MPPQHPKENAKIETSKTEKFKAVELALSQIEKNFGKGAIMRMGENTKVAVETFPSGSISLDVALGGGVPH
ncbi:DNA recombination/repair protein RecA, partial [Candidatus Peregrinibacteria bacterium]|nr:DNA recombination/repair protein RecA [Candidatus Peregrinibacteria bacterium]